MCIRDRLKTADEKPVGTFTVWFYSFMANALSLIAVSYTHLDVYKRQWYKSDKGSVDFIDNLSKPLIL